MTARPISRFIPEHLDRYYKEAKKKGWSVELTKNTHLRWTRPDGAFAHTGSKRSSGRSGANEIGQLRRLGLDL